MTIQKYNVSFKLALNGYSEEYCDNFVKILITHMPLIMEEELIKYGYSGETLVIDQEVNKNES